MASNTNQTYFLTLKDLQKRAYAPYSNFRVACLLWTDAGWFSGVNVENCAYSPTLCAERNAVGAMVVGGAKKILRAFVLTDSPKPDGTPCGVCRQVLSEFASPEVPVIVFASNGEAKRYTVGELLPAAFSAAQLKP